MCSLVQKKTEAYMFLQRMFYFQLEPFNILTDSVQNTNEIRSGTHESL